MKYRVLMAAIILISLAWAVPGASVGLSIYYSDVEGGAATLVVTPARETILIDAGWLSADNRDAQRIMTTMKSAGVSTIDHMIVTHYHNDHWGGLSALSSLVPIRRFYDHGPLKESFEDKEFPQKYAAYRVVTKGKSKRLKPGDQIKLKGSAGTPPVTLTCVASSREVTRPRGGASQNPFCDGASLKEEDRSDNARSLAMVIRFGDFDFLDAGDLTWNIEHKLVCPTNLIGKIDLYQVTHHGSDQSNNTALLRSIAPKAAIMNNGARKGGSLDVIAAIKGLSSIEAFYQLHRNVTIPAEANVSEDFIANLSQENDQAFSITVVTDSAGKSFKITNTRNGRTTTHQTH